MTPDDPRHGKKTGYNQGCREDCCRRANMRALKRFRMGLSPKLIDATGTHRRIQALMSLGWTLQEISTAAGGYTKNWTSEVLKQPRVVETTAAKVARVYDNLGMTVPEGPLRQRTRNRARRNGWLPPLAWNDIDDPNETPAGWQYVAPDRATELRDLAEQRVGITEACRRLKTSRDALEKWCQRHGMSDLYVELTARETAVFERRNQHTRETAA